jgi:hypothetical protein
MVYHLVAYEQEVRLNDVGDSQRSSLGQPRPVTLHEAYTVLVAFAGLYLAVTAGAQVFALF